MKPIITLTTDFGLQDWFVGTLKGVILSIAPDAQLVDITHQIPPGDIRAGAFALAASYRFFPTGTIHLVVIDPGVGSARAPIAVATREGYFVAPDNGVLSLVLEHSAPKAIHRLDNRKYCLPVISRTFHGRDVFAPAAAHLSRGVKLRDLGREQKDFVRVTFASPVVRAGRVTGEVVYIDRFGNAITNIPNEMSHPAKRPRVRLSSRAGHVPIVDCYAAVPKGKPLAIAGSAGYLEIAVNSGNAAQELGVKVGQRVRLECR